jgi:hypothetical protein
MAHLWLRERNEWQCCSLDPPTTLPFWLDGGADAWITRSGGLRGEAWVVYGNRHLLINGMPLYAGVRLLRDRDEIIAADGSPRYFSTERRAAIETFASPGRPVRCPRCRRPLEPGQLVVRCPRPACGLAHHQLPESPCFTYAEHCAGCQHPSNLSDGYQWTPAVLR